MKTEEMLSKSHHSRGVVAVKHAQTHLNSGMRELELALNELQTHSSNDKVKLAVLVNNAQLCHENADVLSKQFLLTVYNSASPSSYPPKLYRKINRLLKKQSKLVRLMAKLERKLKNSSISGAKSEYRTPIIVYILEIIIAVIYEYKNNAGAVAEAIMGEYSTNAGDVLEEVQTR